MFFVLRCNKASRINGQLKCSAEIKSLIKSALYYLTVDIYYRERVFVLSRECGLNET